MKLLSLLKVPDKILSSSVESKENVYPRSLHIPQQTDCDNWSLSGRQQYET